MNKDNSNPISPTSSDMGIFYTKMNTNRKSKIKGVYKTISFVNRNKIAEVYYRKAIMAEMEKLIKALYSDVKRNYAVIPVQK